MAHDKAENIIEKATPKSSLLVLSDTITQWGNLIKGITTTIVGLSFAFYLFGFMIVNNYLQSFGSKDFEIAKPSYLTAGTAFLATILISIGLPIVYEVLINRIGTKDGNPSFRNFAVSIISAPIFSVVIAGSIIDFLTETRVNDFGGIWSELSQHSQYYGLIFFLTFTFALLSPSLIDSTHYGSIVLRKSSASTIIGLPFYFIVMMLMLITSWSKDIYPRIAAPYGGGRLHSIQIVPADQTSTQILLSIGIPITNNTITEPLKLIDENNESVLVLLPNGNSSRISKSFIASIIYISPQKVTSQSTP